MAAWESAPIRVGGRVGLPALRTRGRALAVATLGLALAIERTVLLNPDLTGGFSGTVVGDITLLGVDLSSVRHPERYALVTPACAVAVPPPAATPRRSPAGRRLPATRANPRAAAAPRLAVRLATPLPLPLAPATRPGGGAPLAL